MERLRPSQLRSLPKVDLHRHLDCSWRWSTLVELAPQVGIELPLTDPEKRELFLTTAPMNDLGAVLARFLRVQKFFVSEEILTRLAFEACEDAYNDGVLVLELRYAPTFVAAEGGLSFEAIHRSFLKGIELAQRRWPMAVGLIAIVQRIHSVKDADRVMSFVLDQGKTFIGVDLADNEDGFDPKTFAPVFARAAKAGLPITIHSGEAPHPQAADWVRDSVELLGARRIGHGIQIVRDRGVMDLVRSRGIVLEVCPHSNELTKAFPSEAEHPLRTLWNAGVLCTLGSDDPGVFASLLSDDYEIAQRVHGFGLAEFRRANEIALQASFLPPTEIARVWPRSL